MVYVVVALVQAAVTNRSIEVIKLLAGITMVVAAAVADCVTVANCAISTKPTFLTEPAAVPVVLRTSPALIGPVKVTVLI
jgi:hypothetical protein